MQLVSAIEQCVEAMRHEGSSDDEIIDGLVAQGLERAFSIRIVQFVPIAFAYAILDGRGPTLAPNYHVRHIDGSTTVHSLASEPIYVAAFSIATTLDGDMAMTVAARSATFRSIVNALNDGAKLENLYSAGPTILQHAESDSARKRWWHFWG